MNQETPEPKRVRAVQLGQMLKMKFTPDIQLLGQLIFAKNHRNDRIGPRGGGKSLLSMLMSYAIIGGKPLEPWGSGSGMPVAYLDGEMRAIGFRVGCACYMRGIRAWSRFAKCNRTSTSSAATCEGRDRLD